MSDQAAKFNTILPEIRIGNDDSFRVFWTASRRPPLFPLGRLSEFFGEARLAIPPTIGLPLLPSTEIKDDFKSISGALARREACSIDVRPM